jgi:hypothetical protein
MRNFPSDTAAAFFRAIEARISLNLLKFLDADA